jgi:hypothetical protein
MTSDDDDELSPTASASSSVEFAYKSPEHLQQSGEFRTPEEAAKGALSLELSARCSLYLSNSLSLSLCLFLYVSFSRLKRLAPVRSLLHDDFVRRRDSEIPYVAEGLMPASLRPHACELKAS